MKKIFFKLLAMVLCAVSVQASFSSAPASNEASNNVSVKYEMKEMASSLRHIKAYDSLDKEIGYIAYSCFTFSNCRINKLSVDCQFRNQGIGAQLIKKALADIRATCGNRDVDLIAAPFGDECMDLKTLIALYQKQGAITVRKKIKEADMKFLATNGVSHEK